LELLKKDNGIEIIYEGPIVSLYEIVTSPSFQPIMVKSPNKCNKLYFTAEPLSTTYIQIIQDLKLKVSCENTIPILMAQKYGIITQKDIKIWIFPNKDNNNIVVIEDKSIGHERLNGALSYIFQNRVSWWLNGFLCEEPIKNIKFTITEIEINSDLRRCGLGQLISAIRRGFYSAFLCSIPRIEEPFYEIIISYHKKYDQEIYEIIDNRDGKIISKTLYGFNNDEKISIKFEIPIFNSFGIQQDLNRILQDNYEIYYKDIEYRMIKDDPLDHFTRSGMIVNLMRKFKSDNPNAYSLNSFIQQILGAARFLCERMGNYLWSTYCKLPRNYNL